METVTVTRSFDAPEVAVREVVLDDIPAFVRASGFDRIGVADEAITVSKDIGMATFELTLEQRESSHLLAFEQTEGLFDRMWTDYRLDSAEGGAKLTAMTEFSLGGVLAPVLEPTMITRQRTTEFERQFDYVAVELAEE